MSKAVYWVVVWLVILAATVVVSQSVAHGAPPGGSKKWELVFVDEFNGPTLDLTRWSYDMPWSAPNNGANGELQMYDASAVQLNGGKLKLWAVKPASSVSWWGGGQHQYVSAMVHTANKVNVHPGSYVEMRAKLPKGKGLWPAFWLLPYPLGQWPPEIDVMESLGHESTVVYFNRHFQQDGQFRHTSGHFAGPDFSEKYHRFGVLWEDEHLVFYVDGKKQYELTDHVPNEPMYLLLNLAVGGHWPGNPDEQTRFPQSYQIDWVKVWQRKR